MIQKRSQPLSKISRKDSGIRVFPMSPNSLVVGGEFLNLSHACDFSEGVGENSKNSKMDQSGFKSSIEM